jgi:hypothetical protein
MSEIILGSSDLCFEGEARYRYFGNNDELINSRSLRRITTTLEFKKPADENLQIIIKLPIPFIITTPVNTFFYVDLLTESITCEDAIELNKIKISEIRFQVINWKIRVEGLIEYQKEPNSYPIEFHLIAKFLLKPETSFSMTDILRSRLK